MDFASISNLNSYIKTANMKNIWQQKANNPFKAVIPGSAPSRQDQWTPGSISGDSRVSSIVNKMQSGKELSAEEMEYLRVNAPELYDQAVALNREKKEYEQKLQNCKTKDEARMLQMNKVAEAVSQVKSAAARGDVGACVMACAKLVTMTDVYVKFTSTSKFAQMAETASELNEAIDAEKEAVSGETEVKEEDPANEPQPDQDVPESQELSAQAENTDVVEEKSGHIDHNGKPGPDKGKPTHGSGKPKPVEINLRPESIGRGENPKPVKAPTGAKAAHPSVKTTEHVAGKAVFSSNTGIERDLPGANNKLRIRV